MKAFGCLIAGCAEELCISDELQIRSPRRTVPKTGVATDSARFVFLGAVEDLHMKALQPVRIQLKKPLRVRIAGISD